MSGEPHVRIDRGRLAEPTSMARQNKHLPGKPEGLSLHDLTMKAEPAAYLTFTTHSGGSFDCRIAGSWGFSSPFGPARTCGRRFRWTGWSADCCTKSPKPSAYPRRGEQRGSTGPFPRQSEVSDEASGEAQLGQCGDDDPCPAVCLCRRTKRRRGPSEGVLRQPIRVLDVEAS